MPSLLLNLDKHSHFPYLLDIEMTVFYRDDFLKILYIKYKRFKIFFSGKTNCYYFFGHKK